MYNKLFTKILDSSIWLEPTPTRIVWVTFLAAMDEHGFVSFASPGNVAQRAVVTLDEARAAIACLESADPDSSDSAHEGRRIERVPGGWVILNAEKYRALSTRATQMEHNRERVRRYREKIAAEGSHAAVTPATLGNASVTQSEAYTEVIASSGDGAGPRSRSKAAGPGSPKRPIAKTPPIKALLAEHERLFTARYGEKPGSYTGKDAKLAQSLLKDHGPDRAGAMLRVFFDSDDPFFKSTGHSFAAFAGCRTKLQTMTARPVNGQKVEPRLYDCPVCGDCHVGTSDQGCTRDQGPVYTCRVCHQPHQGDDPEWCPTRKVHHDERPAPLRQVVAG
jgi:hypothetical protein